MLRGQQRQVRVRVRGDAARGRRLREVGGQVGRLPSDHREQRVGAERRRAWKSRDGASGRVKSREITRGYEWPRAAPGSSVTSVAALSSGCNDSDSFAVNCSVFAVKSVLLLTSSM